MAAVIMTAARAAAFPHAATSLHAPTSPTPRTPGSESESDDFAFVARRRRVPSDGDGTRPSSDEILFRDGRVRDWWTRQREYPSPAVDGLTGPNRHVSVLSVFYAVEDSPAQQPVVKLRVGKTRKYHFIQQFPPSTAVTGVTDGTRPSAPPGRTLDGRVTPVGRI
ncbi:hypothetical protein DFH09DRAFT_1086341 [Mycena vulgaris]|nr:hypothetical protein DFH09DRAFT_1086341 [Mycena vulgaris]